MVLVCIQHAITDSFEERNKSDSTTTDSSGKLKKHRKSSKENNPVGKLDALSLSSTNCLKPKFVGRSKHGPVNLDIGRGLPAPTLPSSSSPPPLPDSRIPSSVHYQSPQITQYALPENPGTSALRELDPPDFPHGRHYDELQSKEEPGASPAQLEDSTPKQHHSASCAPVLMTTSKSSSNGKAGDKRVQCSGITLAGKYCGRQTEADPTLKNWYCHDHIYIVTICQTIPRASSNSKASKKHTEYSVIAQLGECYRLAVKIDPVLETLHPDITVAEFVNWQKTLYFNQNNVSVDFSKYIPNYLHSDTQDALLAEMMKPPTKSDGPGYVYALEMRTLDADTPEDSSSNMPNSKAFVLKVGRTVELNRRLSSWKRQCRNKEQLLCGWWPGTIADANSNHNCDGDGVGKYDSGEMCLMKGHVEPGKKGAFCHKLERLVHIELADLVVYAPYLKKNFPNLSTEELADAGIPQSNPRTPRKGGKRAGTSSEALRTLRTGNAACTGCGTVHREIFSFLRPEKSSYKGREWDLLVMPVIKKWGRFVESLQ